MEHASFTPLIFTINGAMGEECFGKIALVRSMRYVQVVHVPSKTVEWQ